MIALDLFHPESIEEAVGLLAVHDGARCISGGATLVAMMNAGLVQPDVLVSLERIHGLSGIGRNDDGSVRIAAMTRHAETATSTVFADGQRVVPLAATHIANPVVRNMGTIGGSVSFADPAADYLAALAAADAVVEIASPRGVRTIAIRDFVVDWYTTVLEPDEIVTALTVPAAPPGSIGHFEKLERVSGDFAIVSVALVVAFDRGICTHAQIAIGGCGPAPLRRPDAEALLVGSRLEPDRIASAARLLVEVSDPVDDVRATADYRRAVLPRLLAKVLGEVQAGVST